MTLSPITALTPNLGAPASREPAKSADPFADLLGGQAARSRHDPAPAPARSDARPAPEAKPAERPERPAAKDSAAPRDAQRREAPARDGAKKADARNGKETKAGDADSAAKDSGETLKTNAKTKAANGENAGEVTANANASEVAAAVLALVQNGEAKAPAEVGTLAANTAVTAAGAPATPAVTAESAVAGAAPVPGDELPVEDAPPVPANNANAKKTPAPVEATVTTDGKALVSRPSAALTAANVQDFAEPAPATPEPKAADPKAVLNAAISPDGRNVSQEQTGKESSGKSTPAPAPSSAPALNLAADPAKKLDIAAPASQPADKPAAPVQTQTSGPSPATAAPVFAANVEAPAPAPNVSVGARPTISPAAAAANIDHVALQIGKAAADGLDRINIQLKPESLGRIDVQLQVHSDGRIHATIAADRQDTLDLLQRDARSLERALNDAGLRADAGSLNFNLNGRGQDGGTGAPGNPAPSALAGDAPADDAQPVPLSAAAYDAAAARGGVDIRV